MRTDVGELEKFLDELLVRARSKRYAPKTFISMRYRYGAIEAIRRLVETSEPQDGFRRLKFLGLTNWSIEAAVVRFPDLFPAKTLAYAQARLEGKLNV